MAPKRTAGHPELNATPKPLPSWPRGRDTRPLTQHGKGRGKALLCAEALGCEGSDPPGPCPRHSCPAPLGPHNSWCGLPSQLPKCPSRAVPSPPPWGVLGSLWPSAGFRDQAASEKWTEHFRQVPGGIPLCGRISHHSSFCPGPAWAGTWQLERGPGLLNLWEWGRGRSQCSASPARVWVLHPHESLPSHGPRAEPRPQGQLRGPSCAVAYFAWVPSGIIPHTGCGCRRPHPKAGTPASCESVCSHSWACPRGASAWSGHSSPCQLPSTP